MSSQNTSKETSKAIGIDLGTTYSCVCAYRNGELEVISNEEGARITPSIVAFDDEGNIVIGTAAEHRLTSNPDKVVYDVKRLIGRGYDSPVLESSIKKWPFRVVRWDNDRNSTTDRPAKSDAVDNIRIEIMKGGKVMHYDPMEISGYVLGFLKRAAEAVLNSGVTTAVITVPAHFNDNQKEKTKMAAEIAGFKNVRLLNEPTAAALSYAYDKMRRKEANKEETVLVFDLGGGTFDVSILKFEPPSESGAIAEVLNTEGDTFLGGVDFDNVLFEHCLALFLKQNPSVKKEEIKDRAKRRLRMACEKAKRNLSAMNSTTIEIECLHSDLGLCTSITRALFNSLCMKYFRRCMDRVKGCLLGLAKVKPDYTSEGFLTAASAANTSAINDAIAQVDRVIVVGGSSRIVKIREMLAEIFGEHKLDFSVHPDEAIARGAAYQAALISGGTSLDVECPLLLLDTVPLNISIETLGGVATNIIKKNTVIPTAKTEVFSTASDNQTSVTINIYEGLGEMVEHNNLIGSFNLCGITPARRGMPQIEVTCDVDNNGILVVTAREKGSNKSEKLTVSNSNRKTTPEQLEEMHKKHKEFEEADRKKKENVSAKIEYEAMLYQLNEKVAEVPDQNVKSSLETSLKQHQEWLDAHPNADKDEYVTKKDELMGLLQQVAGSAQGAAPGGFDASNFGGAPPHSTTEPKVDEVD
ncbi:hypothetical protein VCUG_01919 [Vavraia culicis subsp. floridensis]|uniref:Hsp70-like protein n=1 Tax=Vavraia culicis (isolate floridensis) TaxID=948595 RepID=L2GSI2_VAVCU|nr:uncharacterized protein VCUG_01919 [Vavraia culicis subsp. floridensis]ELA46589.1 hypothetical protein VCUG_01919 [Vavraia culicis subsp. floridensis]